jgi:hypothetical protein
MIHYGQACRVPFLLVPFLWASKEKILVHEGRNLKLNSRIRIKKENSMGCNPSRAPAQKNY